SDILEGADTSSVKGFSDELKFILAHKNLFTPDEETIRVCGQWDDFTKRFFHVYQDLALAEVER
ncbi:MAG TPA: hypothetical protein PLG87_05465, partial [Treponemataceae bacterium]|nr:hypothetical protein [Treponemataceae bacterium]